MKSTADALVKEVNNLKGKDQSTDQTLTGLLNKNKEIELKIASLLSFHQSLQLFEDSLAKLRAEDEKIWKEIYTMKNNNLGVILTRLENLINQNTTDIITLKSK